VLSDTADAIRSLLVSRAAREFDGMRDSGDPMEVVISATTNGVTTYTGTLVAAGSDLLLTMYTDCEMIREGNEHERCTVDYYDRERAITLIRMAEKVWPGISDEARA